jgi:hypothetical protein
MQDKNPTLAFQDAINSGRLSDEAPWNQANYAGNYMYMGPDDEGRDTFKHSTTRQYLPQLPGD